MNRKAKNILKAFGKEAYKSRVDYVESFLLDRTSMWGSIAYRHTARRLAVVAILIMLVMGFAVSAYAAVKHYFNYTRIEHTDNDEYVPNGYNDETSKVIFFEPHYIPDGYELESVVYDDIFDEKEWVYKNAEGAVLRIRETGSAQTFNVDNENSIVDRIELDAVEVIVYDFKEGIMGMLQIDDTVISVTGPISVDEMNLIIKGLNR